MTALSPAKLVALRVQRDWSQAETARRAGINQSYYSQLEKQRKTNPSDGVVAKLAEAFGVTVEELT